MPVVELSISKKEEDANKLEVIDNTIRQEILEYAKDFKTSWVNLGRHLYAVWEDKLYYSWGHNNFEDYTEKEVGIKKSLCLKLLKAYLFVEQDEPGYLAKDFRQQNDAAKVPGFDALEVLRLAKSKKELLAKDYAQLRSAVFDKGVDASEVRKDLSVMMRERKPVDPEEEREHRNELAIKKFLGAIEIFNQDMEVLKIIPHNIIEEIKKLKGTLEHQI